MGVKYRELNFLPFVNRHQLDIKEMKAFINALIAKNPSIVPYGKRLYSDIYTSAEGYLTWYLTGEHQLPELTKPITRWPGDEEPTYTVLNGNYANNFLHQHGDLTFKIDHWMWN